jgi:hypothetical protein
LWGATPWPPVLSGKRASPSSTISMARYRGTFTEVVADGRLGP